MGFGSSLTSVQPAFKHSYPKSSPTSFVSPASTVIAVPQEEETYVSTFAVIFNFFSLKMWAAPKSRPQTQLSMLHPSE